MGAWRYILHADLDAFYASVEQLNPLYKGTPLVVGGPPEQRGVVAAASYEARRYGIRSAMPMRTALKLFPGLVRISPRFNRYREVSHQVMDIFLGLTPLVEPISLDEAYLDISQQVSPLKVEKVANDLKSKVKEKTGLVVTIGGGTSKTVCKVASQVAKPDGLLLIRPGKERSFLAPLDVGILSGVGPKTEAMLREHDITTIGDLASRSEQWLGQSFGKRGLDLRIRSLGKDNDQVTPDREAKSLSAEVTMTEDVEEEAILAGKVQQLALRVASQLQHKGVMGKTIYIKLRYADFTTITRQTTLTAPTADGGAISRIACELLRRELRPGQRFRLVGVGVSNFQDTSQLELFPMT